MKMNGILLARGVELRRLWDKYSAAYTAESDPHIKGYYERRQFDIATRLDELCSLADSLGRTSYADFRERVQVSCEKEPTADDAAGTDYIAYVPDPEHDPRKPVIKNKGAHF